MQPAPRPSRWDWFRFSLTLLLLVGAAAAAFIGGCIRRYPVPSEPPEAVMPYSAITTWRRIELPPAVTGADALPSSALRLAVGPDADDVFADTSLVHGPQAGRTADGWSAVLALMEEHAGSIVLLADAGLLGPEVCGRLRPLAARLVVAAGVSGYAEQGGGLREPLEGASRDPLGTARFEEVCAPPAPEAAQPVEDHD
jgi:hypothetical protein